MWQVSVVKDSGHIVVFITAPIVGEADKIADVLVRQRKAACVNVVPQVRSRFRWQGKIESEEEALLIVKTRSELLDEVIGLVTANHSYEVPEVIALPIAGGSEDYLSWLDEETGQQV
jgi:periplasmic divalent cation tolerance protein